MILIVEDDDAFARTFAMALMGAGYSVEVAPDGAKAIAALLTRQHTLAVIDLKLPDMDGTQVLTAARNAGCDLPMVAITGSVPRDLPIDGFAEVFEKPLRLSQLIDVIKKYAGDPMPTLAAPQAQQK